jgi:RNA recognition motif-containing protein
MTLTPSKDAANTALQMHGHELEPDLPLNVFISDPERKKERSDQGANEKEVYVAGLSRFTTKADLEKIFSTVSLGHSGISVILTIFPQYGDLKDIRLALDGNGHAKGYAFVEYDAPVG